MKKYKVGIVGCGQICKVRHAPEYAENPNTELMGFYDMNPDRAKELATQYHCQAFDSLEVTARIRGATGDPYLEEERFQAIVNSGFVEDVAAAIAGQMLDQEKDSRPRLTFLYRTLLGRAPDAAEAAEAEALLESIRCRSDHSDTVSSGSGVIPSRHARSISCAPS